jgi:hypothetical protein
MDRGAPRDDSGRVAPSGVDLIVTGDAAFHGADRAINEPAALAGADPNKEG